MTVVWLQQVLRHHAWHFTHRGMSITGSFLACKLRVHAGACARGADTSRLWQLLNDLLEKGRVPDSITFKGAISALSKNGEWLQSLKVPPPHCMVLSAHAATGCAE